MKQAKKSKRKQPNHLVGLEIQRSRIALIVGERQDGRFTRVGGHHMVWLQNATSLTTEDGLRELTAALTSLVNKEQAGGAGAYVSLSSELCVTRVVAGENEGLQAEARELRERSAQYLSLGAGEKVAVESSRAVDAKHSQTWLTVANKETLDNLVHAITQAGLRVDLLEHSLLSMCRVIGRSGRDSASPVLIIDINERGVDLGVSYRGELLFDYRPGGLDSKHQIGEIVGRHLERIQRYCNRQFRNVSGKISQVFICGIPEELQGVEEQFDASQLQAEVLDVSAVCSDWDFRSGFTPDANFVAPLGLLLIEDSQLEQPAEERGLPDLMDSYRNVWREPLGPALLKAGWPIAATLLLALGVYAAALIEGRGTAAIEAQVAEVKPAVQAFETFRSRTDTAVQRIKYLQTIDRSISNPAYHQLVAAIGQSLPEFVWLKQVRVDDRGMVSIRGPGRSEDVIFEFVRGLKEIPQIADVSLQGQQPTRLSSGPAILFDIKCRYVGNDDLIERTASNE